MKIFIKKCIRYIRNSEAVAAVELALIAPPLILFLVGVFDYGLYMNTTMQLENTARTAAEYVVQGGDPDLISDDVVLLSNMTDIATDIATMDVVAEFVCECRDATEVDCDTDDPGGVCDEDDYMRRFIEVSLTKDYEPILPYPGLPESIDLAGVVRLQMN